MSDREDLPMSLPIADRWFERRRIDDDITLLWEPHVDRLIRCNIWHVRGRDRDLLVDTGLGIVSLAEAARDLFGKPVVAVATHTHYDHIGGLHEFAARLVHRAEAAAMATFTDFATLRSADFDPAILAGLRAAGFAEADELVTAYPHAGFDSGGYRIRSTAPTRIVDEGDAVDLGDRRFEVLHLPGHSPGSLGLWEAASGTLFSGDAIYDGYLIDDLPTSDVGDYIRTMRRLRELPVRVVHGGHKPSFGRERLVAIVDDYLRRKGAG
jgi:glyoxylase-like metal-dependent hydrolase (beta-lactamase superfamily II)